jgi:16S rRNA (uracil1498-N3)-methyltransferase
MRLHRFYINQTPLKTQIVLEDPKLINQWLRVLRLKIGDCVILFDGSGFDYKYMLSDINKKKAELKLLEKNQNSILPSFNLTLCPSLIKKDKLEWVIEKCTELGVGKFEPVISSRSEKKALSLTRLENIAKEAAEQSGRAVVPIIARPISLKEKLNDGQSEFIMFDPSGTEDISVVKSIIKDKPIEVFIGPEGGWTQEEIELFKNKRARIISLGHMTLRAETAAIVGIALMLP